MRPLLDPLDRSSEVLFGLVMVLAYTGSISVTGSGEEPVRTVLVGAIGCNLAWAIVDAAMYLMGVFAERARGLTLLQAVRQTRDGDEAHELIADLLPPALAVMLRAPEIEALRQRVANASAPRVALEWDDYKAAGGVFLIVFLSTFPVVVPFMVMTNAAVALRVAQAIALVLLYFAGAALGRHTGRQPWRAGLLMAGVGAVLSALTFGLGG